jgi:hypothetical protein
MQLFYMSLLMLNDIIDGRFLPMLRLNKNVIEERESGFEFNRIKS